MNDFETKTELYIDRRLSFELNKYQGVFDFQGNQMSIVRNIQPNDFHFNPNIVADGLLLYMASIHIYFIKASKRLIQNQTRFFYY